MNAPSSVPAEADVVIIGGGPGGYVAAIRAAQLGLRTVCVEQDRTLGGTCVNIGCIPSKALLTSSEYFEFTKLHAAEHGFQTTGLTLDLPRMMQRKLDVVAQNTRGIEFLFRKNKVTWLKGNGRITAPGHVDVDGTDYETKNIVIATGSESVPLAGVDVDEKQIVTS
ncbi:MAG: FAD-dependent oxidoreductase, partial [Gemmatimonadales bacterium]